MIVLFDGTASRPWGRMLFAEESAQQAQPPSVRVWGDRTQRIRAAVCRQGDRWFTADDIAALTQCDRDLVGNALARFAARGDLIKARKSPMQRQQYRWGR